MVMKVRDGGRVPLVVVDVNIAHVIIVRVDKQTK